MKNKIISLLKTIIPCIIIAIMIAGVLSFFFKPMLSIGESMSPTIANHEHNIVNRMIYKIHEIERGDIISFLPRGDKDYYVKRVIGLPGETVEIKNNKVYINGKVLKEDYLEEDVYTEAIEKSVYKVPKGTVFVLGDNRMDSTDSRYSKEVGFVDFDSIMGKVVLGFYDMVIYTY